MAKSRPEDEAFEENPRPRSQRRQDRDDDYEEDDRPDRRPRRLEDEEEDDDRPRRKRSRANGALSGVIPYRNGFALAGYYCGFASLICILGSIALLIIMMPRINPFIILVLMFGGGGILGLLAIIFGAMGLSYVNKNPDARGTGHAITGIILGSLEIIGLVVLVLIGFAKSRGF